MQHCKNASVSGSAPASELKSEFSAVALRGGGGVALGAWSPEVLPKAPDLFEDGPFTSQIKYVLLILICSPSIRNPSVRDAVCAASLCVYSTKTALKPSVYILDI